MMEEAASKKIKCDLCPRSFSCTSKLLKHKDIHNREKPFGCHICGKRYSNKSNLSIHSNVHSGKKSFSCTVCKKSFYYKHSVERHMRIHTGVKPFQCNFCYKLFSDKQGLDYHVIGHTGIREKQFVCNVCNKAFSTKSYLTKHEIIHQRSNHTGHLVIKPYSCHQCDKQYKNPNGLKYHNKKCHKNYELVKSDSEIIDYFLEYEVNIKQEIDEADETENETSTLDQASVKGEKNEDIVTSKAYFYIKQEICDNNEQLTLQSKKYQRKSFKCEFCDKNFPEKGALNKHLRVHTKERPFQCLNCDKSFSHKHVLSRHQSVHTGEKRYACDRCDKKYADPSGLARHQSVHENDQI